MPTQLDTTLDVQPLTAFRDNPAELIERLKSTRRPIMLMGMRSPATAVRSYRSGPADDLCRCS